MYGLASSLSGASVFLSSPVHEPLHFHLFTLPRLKIKSLYQGLHSFLLNAVPSTCAAGNPSTLNLEKKYKAGFFLH